MWGFGEPSQQFALEDIGSPEQLLTLYQLMAQLTMDGTRNTTLNYHIVTRKTPEPGTRGVERYTVDNPRSKFWQTTKKRDHPSSDASCHNIGRYLHSSAEQLIPNAVSKATSQHLSKSLNSIAPSSMHCHAQLQLSLSSMYGSSYVALVDSQWLQVVWFLERELSAGATILQIKFPVITWAKAMTVEAGQVIRWA